MARHNRKFTAPVDAERCTGNVILKDGSGAACMHKRIAGTDRCLQHPRDDRRPLDIIRRRLVREARARAKNRGHHLRRFEFWAAGQNLIRSVLSDGRNPRVTSGIAVCKACHANVRLNVIGDPQLEGNALDTICKESR